MPLSPCSRSGWSPPSSQSSPPSPKAASRPWPAMTKSSPSPAKVSLALAPPLVKSLPVPPIRMSRPGPASIASLPGPPLGTSSPPRSVMMSLPSPPSATSAPAPPSMTSLPAPPQKVSLSLPPWIAVDAGGAVVDGLAVDAGRVDGVARAVLDGAVGHAGSAARSRCTPTPGRRRPCCRRRRSPPAVPARLPSSNLQSAVANASALRVCDVGVAHHHLGERVALELGRAGSCPGVRAR